jgi:hypothetical protein
VPDTLALDDGLAAGDDAVDDDVAAGADDEEDDEELHAAAARPRHVMPSTAATRLVDDRNVSMMPTIAISTCVSQ